MCSAFYFGIVFYVYILVVIKHFPKTQEIKKLELLLEKSHQEQNQANGDTSETPTIAETKHIKSKLELDCALRSRIFKLSPKLF